MGLAFSGSLGSTLIPGASFKLELEGPDLSFKDRAILREAGSGCPGRSHAADAEERRFSVSVATYVYHSQGSYEPSPLVHGGPIIAGANTPGWLKASWYPVQLRMPGSYRICYCAASDEGDFVRNSGLILGPNDSPCELDFASYRLVGVAYAMGIKHSEAGSHSSEKDMICGWFAVNFGSYMLIPWSRSVTCFNCFKPRRCQSVLAWCQTMVPCRVAVKFMFERTEVS